MDYLKKLYDYSIEISTEDLRYVKLSQKIKQMYELELHNLHYFNSNGNRKTPITQLIDIIKDKRKESDISNTLLRFCQVEAEKFLDLEKIEIEKAFLSGNENTIMDEYKYTFLDLQPDEYYNSIFNRNVE